MDNFIDFASILVHPTGMVLSKGAYSHVLEVEYKGRKYTAKKYHCMASVKISKSAALKREHKLLSRIKHQNIVSCFGVSNLTTDRSTVIVMEKMDNTLTTLLKRADICLERKVKILSDISKGLHHLHSQTPAIVHRDLTAGNVLLDSCGTAKISDFGNARMINLAAPESHLTSTPGTLDYMPPEALKGGKYDDKLDVFSFGHLAIYVILQHRPHPLLDYNMAGRFTPRTEVERRQYYLDQVKSILEGGESHSLYQLIISCLQMEPGMRPSSEDVSSKIVAAIPKKGSTMVQTFPMPLQISMLKKDVAITPAPRDISCQANSGRVQSSLSSVKHLHDKSSVKPRKFLAIKPINFTFISPWSWSIYPSALERRVGNQSSTGEHSGRGGDIYTSDVDADFRLPNTTVNQTGVVLGQGAHGDVLEVEYGGKLFGAKKYRLTSGGNVTLGAFSREHEILARIRHPNIVPYYGICKLATDKSTVIVMERMDMNLTTFLKERSDIPLEIKTRILIDVAKGLHHLHSQTPAIIHRDLTAGNVMLDSHRTAKIIDFGNSRMIDLYETPELLTSNPGTLDYMPPEAIEGGEYDDRLDVFSFGHLSIYVIIQRRPHPLLRATYTVAGRLFARTEVERRQHYLDQVKLILEGGESHLLYQLIIKCLQDEPSQRPSSGEILRQLMSHK